MVTHPEMKRYFTITSEATLLVLQAGAIGEGGEVFVLDMGEPIKIVDLAKELITLLLIRLSNSPSESLVESFPWPNHNYQNDLVFWIDFVYDSILSSFIAEMIRP